MEVGKWTSTVASIWIQASSGSSYAFSVYSSALKSSQDYSQSTLDTISVFKDIGANAGVLSGLLYSSATSSSSSRDDRRLWRRIAGPWAVHAVGAVQCFIGYFLMWLSVKGVIDRPPVAAMCLFMFLAAHAQTFFNTANVVTAVHNFPDYSGTIVGIMKGFLGLSGAMLIQVYDTFLQGHQSDFILMLALLPTTMSLLLMCLVKIHPSNTGKDKKYLKGFSLVALVISAYLVIVIILENLLTFPESAYVAVFTLLVIFLLSPVKIAALAQKEEDSQPIPQESTSESARTPLMPTDNASEEADKPDMYVDRTLNVLQAMTKVEFWLLFVAMACGLGSGLATVNNLSQIGQSLGYSTVEINTLVSLYSIWNCLGRFGAGYLSDIVLHRNGWPRPVLMVITLGTMTIGHIVVASGFSGNLYIGTILIGVCYGSQWSLMPTITSEIFGVLHMGTIFNTIAIASPVGSYCLSVQVIGRLYDDQTDGGSSCSGKHCFMVSFFIMASVCLLACLLALVLLFRTRAFYRSVVLRRLQHFGGRR